MPLLTVFFFLRLGAATARELSRVKLTLGAVFWFCGLFGAAIFFSGSLFFIKTSFAHGCIRGIEDVAPYVANAGVRNLHQIIIAAMNTIMHIMEAGESSAMKKLPTPPPAAWEDIAFCSEYTA